MEWFVDISWLDSLVLPWSGSLSEPLLLQTNVLTENSNKEQYNMSYVHCLWSKFDKEQNKLNELYPKLTYIASEMLFPERFAGAT